MSKRKKRRKNNDGNNSRPRRKNHTMENTFSTYTKFKKATKGVYHLITSTFTRIRRKRKSAERKWYKDVDQMKDKTEPN